MLKRKVGARSGPRPDIYLVNYPPGSKVAVIIDPATHKGAPHRRYHGKVGTIVEKRGKGYVVSVKLGSKTKYLSLLPEHIKPLQVVGE